MANIIFYRRKCIGCGICFQMLPGYWRLSKKDGKAILLRSTEKKDVFVLPAGNDVKAQLSGLTKACPAKIIKLV